MDRGYDGVVFSTVKTAVKALRYEELYIRERNVYRRLHDRGIRALQGFRIPKLIAADDALRVVEMHIVSPPFVLDFAGASLDVRPDYPRDVQAAWQREKRQQFGQRWPTVQALISAFAAEGIFLSDVKPGNVMFEEPK